MPHKEFIILIAAQLPSTCFISYLSSLKYKFHYVRIISVLYCASKKKTITFMNSLIMVDLVIGKARD